MDGIVSTSSGSEAWNGSGRANGGLGRGKEPGGNCGSGPGAGVSGPENGGLRGVGVWGLGVSGLDVSGLDVWGLGVSGLGVWGLGVWGLRSAGDSGRGSGSAWGGASSQDDDVCEAIHAPVGGVGAEADGDAAPPVSSAESPGTPAPGGPRPGGAWALPGYSGRRNGMRASGRRGESARRGPRGGASDDRRGRLAGPA